jgi:hypothetical protein
MDDLGDLVDDLTGDGGSYGDLLLFKAVRWAIAAVGVAFGAYLLLGDGSVTGTGDDKAGAAIMVGSPLLFIALPYWWRRI